MISLEKNFYAIGCRIDLELAGKHFSPISKHSSSRSCFQDTPAALVLRNRGESSSIEGVRYQFQNSGGYFFFLIVLGNIQPTIGSRFVPESRVFPA